MTVYSGVDGDRCPAGWDSGVDSDCYQGGADHDHVDIGGEFASEGSGVMPSEPNSVCTCNDPQQPDNVKVIEQLNLKYFDEILNISR